MLKSLHLNGYEWKVSFLGEKALLIEPGIETNALALIHQTTRLLEQSKIQGLEDLVPAYQSIALMFNRDLENTEEVLEQIQDELSSGKPAGVDFQTHQVPVCYDFGLDWEKVESHTGLTKKEIISLHKGGEYTVAMMGFVPGFVFLSGMSTRIACPRRESPRTQIPAGSVGIAGNQTGIYSLESPGGWQVIGRTPFSFFDVNSNPPNRLNPGDKVSFYSIGKNEFEKMKGEGPYDRKN